jgi:branched-chain amino acid transport system substrate-binding protein
MSKLTALCFGLMLVTSAQCFAQTPGVTDTEINIGATFPLSGPASAFGNVGRGLAAYVGSLNEKGGINGRKINLIMYDDAYSPPKAVEHTRKLVESDEVAFVFSPLGTQSIGATIKYLNARKVPHLFAISGVSKFANYSEYPMTTTALPSYATEGRIYAKYINKERPNARIAILYQNDDLGKEFLTVFRAQLKDDFDKRVVTSAYEVSEPTIDSHVVKLKATGADVLFVAGTPKFAAQAIKRVHEIEWKPLFVLNLISSSVGAVIEPAGRDKAIGIVAASNTKDPTDPRWNDDAGMKEYHAFFRERLPGSSINDTNYLFGFMQGKILEQVLKQCGNDLSRENIVKQARSLKGLALPTLLPGITVNTDANNSMAYTQLQLRRWTGSSWEHIGDVIGAD